MRDRRRQSAEAVESEMASAKRCLGRRPLTESILEEGAHVRDDQRREDKVSCDNDGFWFEEEGTVSCKDDVV